MKKIYIFISLIFILVGCFTIASDIEPVKGEVGSLIVELENISKDELYIMANSWAVDTFVSAESVIEFQDKEAGIIKGKYFTSFLNGIYLINVKTIITVEVKEGKARIQLTDPLRQAIYHDVGGKIITSYESINTKSIMEKMQPEWDNLLNSFKTTMRSPKKTW